ncbi:MAG TPA: 3-deoxy-D-manno-octulosonic acid transferase, partial [Thermoanaerobaculia bacterium]
IEAWSAGVPVVTGPHTASFREVTADGELRGILERADAASLPRAFARIFANPDALAERGERARGAVVESRGAAGRTAEFVLPLLTRTDLRTASR